ncbi:hypothetical protein O6H91_23G042900 [Diphasiastrum complanatum]|uniref:Uncharacterized protein n=1 Tax=Diphasiastrum complanatum TaxID=34168 RepID=A0ACC2AA61_DIPCM|nr:hypothetical protein O6H91_23G042900 [Diphasiastrum complanatum]
MDRGWRPESSRQQEENEVWDCNSSDEDSSIGEYDGADMPMMHPHEVELEEDVCYEFPHDDLTIVLDGLNKWPWTVYPIQLTNCLSVAAKIANVCGEDLCGEIRRLQTLYREAVPSALEKCLDDKAIWKWNGEVQFNIFEAVCRLMDLIVAKLPQLLSDDVNADEDMLPLMRTLAIAFDKQSQYHLRHKDQTPPQLPLLPHPQKFAKPVSGTPVKQKTGDWYCSHRKGSVREIEGCECNRCKPPDVYGWISYLLNYFGQTPNGNGYQQLLKVLNKPQKLSPAVMEALLLPIAKIVEFITDEVANQFLEPCSKLLTFVADRLEQDVDALGDKTKDGSFGALSLILKHLQVIIGRGASPEEAQSTISVVQRQMVERMLGFNSFNKQLSAVREINKLLENARAIACRDNLSVNTTIQWLEKNDILRRVLRCHLHHKQYVDQVEKIMRFLLQERRLSEEHLDAIWAPTEKPDQFETVKANIFDLLADLAWSFSDEQLDSLFGRFERSQGRSPSDIVKILSLVKKLARSDTKGVMASRLLELLWNMMHTGEAPAEILESGALTEILGHYDSVNCANKDVYISRCLKNIEKGESVIPSLRLLREIILLDRESPFYQGEVSRQVRLQELIKDHGVLHMVVNNLEGYMALARSLSFENAAGLKSCDSSLVVDGHYTHEEHVKERLDFLLFALQYGNVSLAWDAAERLWDCLVEKPACDFDKERGLQWFCDALERFTTISLEAQVNILTRKVTCVDPALLSSTAWRCFMRLFSWVNLKEKKLELLADEGHVTYDLDLIGLPYVWKVALQSPVERIVDDSIELLRDVHTSLSENLQKNLVTIRQHFLDQCMLHLHTAFENGSLGNSREAADSNSIVSRSMTDGNVETEERTILIKEAAQSPGKETYAKDSGTPDHPLATNVGEIDQVERCLRLLKVFIVKCEARCPRKVPAHGASFGGRPFSLQVSTANKQSTRFEVAVQANEYLASLREKVAKRLDCPVSRVRLIYSNRELTQDSQVLQQCGLAGGHPITASVNINERPLEHMDEAKLPGILMSKKPEVYEILFKLAETSDSRVREGANCLLALLPTHPDILADFQSLSKRNTEESKKLLGNLFGSRSRLLYTLQVVDGILMPVDQSATLRIPHFRKDFLRFGGFKHLMSVFEPYALSEVDGLTQRGCYSSALRILKFLLMGKDQENTYSAAFGETTLISPRTDLGREIEDHVEKAPSETTVSMSVNSSEVTDLEFPQSNGKKDMNEDDAIDMGLVVGALKRLASATALGHLSMSNESPPVSPSQQNSNSRIEKKHALLHGKDMMLDKEDQYLCLESMELLVNCLVANKSLIESFFLSADSGRFIVDMVLHPSDEVVRLFAATNISNCIRSAAGVKISHKPILAALIGTKSEASKQPKHCLDFMKLLGDLFHTIEDVEEYEMAKKQLADELYWLKSAPAAVDENDKLLEGHLQLVQELVEVLDSRIIGSSRSPRGAGLVQQLIKTYLFPESAILWGNMEDFERSNGIFVNFGVLGNSLVDDSFFQSKCGTPSSRKKAFQLLTCLATHCIENLREIVELLIKIHFSTEIQEWEHLPSNGRKAVGGYVGLKNAGATCYMNSVFQQLYMQPDVRRTVLACSECDDLEKQDSVFFQLQVMFGSLLGSSLDHYTPQGFWYAYRDYDGLPINLREHQDAFEFFNRLYDAVDETLKATHQEVNLTKIFGGVFVQQVISRGCSHKSEREEPFAAISVDVKNKRDLLDSLESFVQGDLLEADNAYHCEGCGVKVDALKRVCVKSLPQTLVIHLKRFDFDYETMQRLKLKDRFEFPMHLDMKPFTVEGLAVRDSQSQGTCSVVTDLSNGCGAGSTMQGNDDDTGKFSPISSRPDSYYQYDLVGVVVHSGTAFAGHYYSYIKERPGDGNFRCSEESLCRWIAFDDKRVEPYDINDLEKDCFGGKYTVDVYDNFLKTTSPQEFDRPNSAYMLFYERSKSEGNSQADSPAETATSNTKGDDDDGDETMKDIQPVQRVSDMNRSIQMPPCIHRSVWKENLRFVHESHMLDKDYFKFLHNMVEANIDVMEVRHNRLLIDLEDQCDGSRDRKGETTGRNGENLGALDLHANEFSKLNIVLASEFLLRIYLRTHSSLREDLPRWKALIRRLFEKNILACRCFLDTLVKRPQWIHDYLLKCPVDEIRQTFADLLVHAFQTAALFLQGNILYTDGHGRQSDALHVDAVIHILMSFLRDAASSPKIYLNQYFQVILEYAKVGATQRSHLLQKSLVSQLVLLATKLHVVKHSDLSCLHSIISLLVRSCDTSKFYDVPEMDTEKLFRDGEGSSSSQIGTPLPNPLQLPPPVVPLPNDAADSILKHAVYASILVKTCPDHDEGLKLLEFCCWQNETFSSAVLQEILDALHGAGNNEIKFLLALILRILQLADSLQLARQEIALLGDGRFPPGLMDLIVSKGITVHKRYSLLKFVVKLVSVSPPARRHLLGRKQDWRRAVDWLQQELHVRGSPGALSVPPVSNEDVSNGYLLRTTTAEWTLASARNLFN